MKIESIRLENEFFMNIEIVRVVELIMKRDGLVSVRCFCNVGMRLFSWETLMKVFLFFL